MDLLLDTHTIIWFITDNAKLPEYSKKVIEDKSNNCYVSIASYWEIGIKYSLGRLDLKTNLETIFKIIEETNFEILPITLNHILNNTKLKFHHQDPFVRMILAQAQAENMAIISKDEQFEKYDIKLIWKE